MRRSESEPDWRLFGDYVSKRNHEWTLIGTNVFGFV
jgi:hypothetical protein